MANIAQVHGDVEELELALRVKPVDVRLLTLVAATIDANRAAIAMAAANQSIIVPEDFVFAAAATSDNILSQDPSLTKDRALLEPSNHCGQQLMGATCLLVVLLLRCTCEEPWDKGKESGRHASIWSN